MGKKLILDRGEDRRRDEPNRMTPAPALGRISWALADVEKTTLAVIVTLTFSVIGVVGDYFLKLASAREQPLRVILQFADRFGLWPLLGGGCHPARDTAPAIERAGFAIERCERFAFSPNPPMPAVPHILGVARRVTTGYQSVTGRIP